MIQILDADTSKVLMSFKPVLDTNDGVRIYRPEPDPAVRIGRSYNTMQPSELDLGLGPTDAVPNWVLHIMGPTYRGEFPQHHVQLSRVPSVQFVAAIFILAAGGYNI
jgi:hypothetical protein